MNKHTMQAWLMQHSPEFVLLDRKIREEIAEAAINFEGQAHETQRSKDDQLGLNGMTDITKIAQACASRIMDRMEMCRKDRLAILKSDIEREVETALKEYDAANSKLWWCDENGLVDPSIIADLDARYNEIAARHGFDVPGAKTSAPDNATPASIADKALKALADAHVPEFSGVKLGEPYAGFRFRVDGDTLIHEPIPMEEFFAHPPVDESEAKPKYAPHWIIDENGARPFKTALDYLGETRQKALETASDGWPTITVEEAEKRGIPIGSAGYVWIA